MPERRASIQRNPGTLVRAFYALWPDASASDALTLLARETARRTRGRAQPAGNLHLTLVFLGEVAVARVTALCAIGVGAASTAPSFPLTLDRTGTFRGSGIAWAGASAVPHELGDLVLHMRDALTAEGFAIERRDFRPHVTLARHGGNPGDIQIAAPIVWNVSRFALNASEPGSGGPRYSELASWSLGLRTADDRTRCGTMSTGRASCS